MGLGAISDSWCKKATWFHACDFEAWNYVAFRSENGLVFLKISKNFKKLFEHWDLTHFFTVPGLKVDG